MKRNATLFVVALASVIFLYAQDNAPVEMTGWICTSACATQSAGHASCDASCAGNDKNGDVVFVDDNGKVTKISNPDMVTGKMGQKVKVKCKMDENKEFMQILDVATHPG
jgi:hypothetical protein